MSDQNRPNMPPGSDQQEFLRQPMRVGHGRRIMDGVVTTRRDVSATQSTAQAILDLLTPEEGEPNAILEALENLALSIRHQQATSDEMVRLLRDIAARLDRIERRQR